MLPLIAVLPFLIAVRAPVLFDSYTHLVEASTGSFADAVNRAYVQPSVDFRPLGYIDYWLEYKWAGFHAWSWHLDGLVLHLAAVYLVFVLCRKLHLSPLASSFAALFFGLSGINPEDVFWTASRFDQLAAIFVLLTLIAACEYADKRNGAYIPAMLVCCVLALISKESAFCVTGLAACCLWYRGTLKFGQTRRLTSATPIWRQGFGNAQAVSGLKATGAIAAVSIAVFAYRYSAIGGLGGYRDANGALIVLDFRIVHLLEVLVFRIWGVLVFPINWSVAPQVWLGICLLLFVCTAFASGIASKPQMRRILAALAFCIVGIAPAAADHLASLTATLSGSRVFYIPLIGLALLVGAVFDGFRSKRLASAAVTGFLLFQSAALLHNLLIWRDTAYLAKRTCVAFARFADNPQPLHLAPLPRLHHGVYFLANGFTNCVFVNTGKRIAISPAAAEAKGSAFRWDEKSLSIRKESRP